MYTSIYIIYIFICREKGVFIFVKPYVAIYIYGLMIGIDHEFAMISLYKMYT